MYAQITDGEVSAVGRLPGAARRLDNGAWVLGLDQPFTSDEDRAACGWFPVTDNPPTFDPATEVRERRDVIVVDGLPVVEYAVRAKTAAELAADAQAAQDEQERQQAKQAYDNLGDYIALSSPTAAQTVAVVKLLCRVARRLILDQYGR